MDPYTGVDGNKIISDIIQDINYVLIDLKDEGWFTNVNYVPKRWESPTHKIKSDSISIVIKKKENESGSRYPSNGSIFNVQDIKQYLERIGEMFGENDIKVRTCKPNPDEGWKNYSVGIWSPLSSNYYRNGLKNDDDVFGVEVIVFLKGENIDQNESKRNMKYLKTYKLFESLSKNNSDYADLIDILQSTVFDDYDIVGKTTESFDDDENPLHSFWSIRRDEGGTGIWHDVSDINKVGNNDIRYLCVFNIDENIKDKFCEDVKSLKDRIESQIGRGLIIEEEDTAAWKGDILLYDFVLKLEI